MSARSKLSQSSTPYRTSARSKVFRSGGSLALRLPKDFQPEDDEVMITRVKEGLLISPIAAVSAVADWWDGWPADPDFMADGRQQPAMQDRDLRH
jgi:virulence-associated protein VagC